MVVSLLALLFVIVTGYLSLARFERQTFDIVSSRAGVESITRAVNDLVRSRMREQWRDTATGKLLAGPTAGRDLISREDIPGYGRSSYLAGGLAFDPRTPDADILTTFGTLPVPFNQIQFNRYTAVSSLGPSYREQGNASLPSLPQQPRLAELMLDGNQEFTQFQFADLAFNARSIMLDADGDGIPDASFVANALATDLANSIAGVQTPAPRSAVEKQNALATGLLNRPFKPYRLVDPNTDSGTGAATLTTSDEQWAVFDQLARYIVVTRTVSHGGMISLDAPSRGNSKSWNRLLAARLFNCMERDGLTLSEANDALFDAIHGQAPAIEAQLRRRGGLLPSWVPDGQTDRSLASVPEPLRALERDFPATFDLGYGATFALDRAKSWQRFNLTRNGQSHDKDFWRALSASRVNAQNFTPASNPNPEDSVIRFDRRHLFTANSNSDDLARRQRKDAVRSSTVFADRFGLHHGQTKFNLGEISNAYGPGGVFLGENDPTRAGLDIGRRLVDYYYDMLSAHDPNEASLSQADDLLEQAYMLAVNTLQFAAPRQQTPAGFMDVASLQSESYRYIGYGPQPFISQVALYGDDPNDPNEDLSLLVELYNPNDPTNFGNLANDAHALYMPQFAISLNDRYQNVIGIPPVDQMIILAEGADAARRINVYRPAELGAPNRFPGRTFTTVSIAQGTSNFVNLTDSNNVRVAHSLVTNYPVELNSSNQVRVKLWKRNAGGEWFQIDELVVNGIGGTPNDTWMTVAWRDMNSEIYFGGQGTTANYPLAARWRMVAAWEPQDPNDPTSLNDDPLYTERTLTGGFDVIANSTIAANSAIPTAVRNTFARPEPDYSPVPIPNLRFGPTTPFYTMNAMPLNTNQRNRLVIHGSRRPESFPTVGFMLHIPRFSHVQQQTPGLPPLQRWPMGTVLRDLWIGANMGLTTVPADFGHMPIFDNKRDLYDKPNEPKPYFSAAGKIPWGQLVFDYFTTIDPNGPDGQAATQDDIDPLRIPGRININAADWYTLAQLPLIGPNGNPDASIDGNGTGIVVQNAPAENVPSPAFWASQSGILAGRDNDPNVVNGAQRYLGLPGFSLEFGSKSLPQRRGDTNWWTLGANLGLAAASYRDGIPYVADVQNDTTNPAWPYHRSYLRNWSSGVGVRAPYRAAGPYGSAASNVRGADPNTALPGGPMHYGFLSVGELANVIGFDGTPPGNVANPIGLASATGVSDPWQTLGDNTQFRHGDFMKAVSVLTFLDSQCLTTRSNTFTIYVSVFDRQNPEASVRSQMTVDRSNLLPRFVWKDEPVNGVMGDGFDVLTTVERDGLPAVIAERTSAYFNARHDD